jgi:hypothetical protein
MVAPEPLLAGDRELGEGGLGFVVLFRCLWPGIGREASMPTPTRDPSQGEAATAALASALGSGQLDPAAFSASVNRVTALRASLF